MKDFKDYSGSIIQIKEGVMGHFLNKDNTISIVDFSIGDLLLLLESDVHNSVVLVPGCGKVSLPTYIDVCTNDKTISQVLNSTEIIPTFECVQI